MRVETIGDCTLYCGDCLEVLPTLGKVDAVVTDPPWKTSSANIEVRLHGVAPVVNKTKSLEYGSIGFWSGEAITKCIELADGDVFIVSGWKEMPELLPICEPLRGIFVWHKGNGLPTLSYPARMDVAFVVWTGRHSTLYGHEIWNSMVWKHNNPQAGCFATERILQKNSGKSAHPCQGPLSLYMQMVTALPQAATVLDPFMGSGTTGVACVKTGRKFIGIEIDPTYFDIACKRIEAATLQLRLPLEEA